MMLACRRSVCVSGIVRKRMLSTASPTTKEDKIKIEAEPPTSGTNNWIGPPDPVSNIRPIKFQVPADETSLERNFRQRQAETIQWNHDFWQRHNAKFFKQKDEFAEKIKQTTGSKASPDELSQFYRKFLDENRHEHLRYNRDWYKKNISLLWPALQVTVIRAIRRLKHIKQPNK